MIHIIGEKGIQIYNYLQHFIKKKFLEICSLGNVAREERVVAADSSIEVINPPDNVSNTVVVETSHIQPITATTNTHTTSMAK